MNRLTDNDLTRGPFTFAKWKNRFSATLESGDDEDPETFLLFVGFGRALRIEMPFRLKPFGKYGEHSRRYGFSLSKDGAGYDFLQVHLGPSTGDSSTTKDWCKHLPWKQWKHVRRSIYRPDGTHFATEEKGKWHEFYEICKTCPKSFFVFRDYDGKEIVAACTIEEMEWHRGEGWFSWLRFFYPKKIRRSIDIKFSEEVGPEKGSWKGGTIGTGIDMLVGETPEDAFRRYCQKEHRSKYRKFEVEFIGNAEPTATVL